MCPNKMGKGGIRILTVSLLPLLPAISRGRIMRLFDEFNRKDIDSADFLEPSFQYLNRSARPAFQFVRQMLESWFLRYPTEGQHELQSRFRSRLNVHHTSAFFELFLHELLFCLGCAVVIHPSVKGTTRSPDFFVEPQSGESFYLEATVATFQSKEEAAAEARLNQVYDVLNRHVDSTNFFISVDVNESPTFQPPGRKIAHFLNQKLKDLDPDEVTRRYESEGYKSLPTWKFQHEGWSVLFDPIPKKPEARGKLGVQPLGMFTSGVKWVDHRTPLRDAIIDKASAYGNLEQPFIVAVNAMKIIDDISAMEALFGKEQFNLLFSQTSPVDVVDTKMTRIPDGVWTSRHGPTNTQLSAALIVRNLRPWSIGESACRLYHNPWALAPYSSSLTDLPQAVPDKEQIGKVKGRAFVEILGIDWPSMAG